MQNLLLVGNTAAKERKQLGLVFFLLSILIFIFDITAKKESTLSCKGDTRTTLFSMFLFSFVFHNLVYVRKLDCVHK